MSVIGNNILMGAAGQGGGYTIDRSVRLRSSASAYFSRTPASAGNRKTWTWSAWVKRGQLGVLSPLFGHISSDANNQHYIRFLADNTLDFAYYTGGGYGARLVTTQVFRDVAAWFHLVAVWDTANSTSGNRMRIYINGVEVTSFSTDTNPTLNLDGFINATVGHGLGTYAPYLSNYLDGYLTEVNFIDGQALDPSSFGDYNEDTGVWQPAKYAGTYGTNGFYLDFSDNTTTTTLGEDGSGNGNDWTANNISLTSGATYDSMTDVPTLTSEDAGNFAVLNPLDATSGVTDAEGNLKWTAGSPYNTANRATISVTSGKWYWEISPTGTYGNFTLLGVADVTAAITNAGRTTSNAWYYFGLNGNKYNGSAVAYGATFGTGDVIGVALDMDAGTLTFYKNNTSQGAAFSSGLSGKTLSPVLHDGAADASAYVNFGQRPFAYTPPSGFLPLHTGNLPDSAIVDGSQYFDSLLWTSTATVKDVTGSNFQPDLVWVKSRASASANEGYHHLVDAVRGAGKVLSSNVTDAEYWTGTNNSVQAFLPNGFTAGDADGLNGNAMVSWLWKANGAGVSNTDGSITSTVSANPTSGFSIVTYTGNGSTSPYPTVGHGLGVAPQLIFTKARSTTSNWVAYTTVIDGSLDFLYLNTTAAKANSGLPTLPTSSVFQVGGPDNNSSGQTHVAYCFAEVEGYSKFGSYTGNGSADGPFIFTNFRPAFVMVKRVNATNNWIMWDNNRSQSNVVDDWLYANLSDAEASANGADFLSNGFKLRNSANAINGAEPYIFMAFAESPFKSSLAR